MLDWEVLPSCVVQVVNLVSGYIMMDWLRFPASMILFVRVLWNPVGRITWFPLLRWGVRALRNIVFFVATRGLAF